MKVKLRLIPVILFTAIYLYSCEDDNIEKLKYTANVPVYMTYDELRSDFEIKEQQDIQQPGKIYFKDDYLFVNEVEKGIHVINNRDPANPQIVGFYNIPGNIDMAIRGNTLYADSYIDLVAIDVSDLNNPVEIDRLKNVFPKTIPAGDLRYSYTGYDNSKGIVVDWELKTVVVEYDPDKDHNSRMPNHYYPYEHNRSMDITTADSWSGGAGVGGSMARFMLNRQYLYLIAKPQILKTVDVENENKMKVMDSIDVPRFMETLFRLEDKLFIGTTTGMLIFDIEDPVKPRQISEYDHITACDPVVADENYAYVTLRTGTMCMNGDNLLEVIDISSIENPFLVKSYPMHNPHGLGIDNDMLFICDGDAGLKVYDKTDPLKIHLNKIAHFPEFNTYDVIPYNDILMLVGADGIYQYYYKDPENLVQISHIPAIEK